jgi:catechol 2,3-dioxygenase-like lactoylglutathione lyase family enzyme
VDMKLEVVAVPVSDVDRANDLYQSLGWRLDADFVTGPDFPVIQMNPAAGSGCAIIVGTGITSAAPGSAQGLTTRRATSALAAYDSLTGLPEALRRVRRSRTARTRRRRDQLRATLSIGRVVGPPTSPRYRRRLH